ncbi:glycerol-3-phosphate dehydrogenase [Denitrobaculum tricleocarpae]|uniref:Glycerol-3-phosphate dehydrogenase n=1 Tax=Denitrobaculum tricleocarpae TaxID=2591009 RepID=A0A545SZB9_9PROT|nr:glycerol-3-phosphate dehydrogenase [Denitrobaculum tricleocarpae]TQV70317.1 glycerol-3-phosphate dehydrogenase [Denitrobaculum tricleocarpae]
MAKILILGAGVMGSSLSVPALDNGHEVLLAGTHLDVEIIDALKADRSKHPTLRAPLPTEVIPLQIGEVGPEQGAAADVIVVGVSSPGIDWVIGQLIRLVDRPKPIALVTKGLAETGHEKPGAFTDRVRNALGAKGLGDCALIGIGGPCIARELALRQPTSVVFASDELSVAADFARMMQTEYYRVHTSDDLLGVEACAALKNFYAIGVSAMISRYVNPDKAEPAPAKNPTAAVFNQAIQEMARLAAWIGGRRETAFDLAGAGDLHVTVGGGRNSKLGKHLGANLAVTQVMEGPLKGETVEGLDTGRSLAPGLFSAFERGTLNPGAFPLACALLDAILKNKLFAFDHGSLGTALYPMETTS